jgi:uncharacterized small protein (DUF1192 family)
MMSRSTGEQVADLRLALARARGTVIGGGAVDLSGLTDEIARLMAAAHAAPSREHLALRAGIEALLNEIDHLGAELQRQHDAATALRAKDAYGSKVATR